MDTTVKQKQKTMSISLVLTVPTHLVRALKSLAIASPVPKGSSARTILYSQSPAHMARMLMLRIQSTRTRSILYLCSSFVNHALLVLNALIMLRETILSVLQVHSRLIYQHNASHVLLARIAPRLE